MDLFSHGRSWVEVTLRLLVSSSCNQTIKNVIDNLTDQRNEQSKTSLRYQSEWSASGGGWFGFQSKIRLRWSGMKTLSFDRRIQIQIGQKECTLNIKHNRRKRTNFVAKSGYFASVWSICTLNSDGGAKGSLCILSAKSLKLGNVQQPAMETNNERSLSTYDEHQCTYAIFTWVLNIRSTMPTTPV